MNYFKKPGVRTEEEQSMLQAIEQVIDSKGINRNEIPDCNTLDDLVELKHLVDAYITEPDEPAEKFDDVAREDADTVNQDVSREELEDAAEYKSIAPIETVESVENEPHEFIEEDTETDDSIPELAEVVSDENFEDELAFDAGEYDPFAEPIIERSYSGSNKQSSTSDKDELNPMEFNLDLEEASGSTPIDSPELRTKRKAAEQTADTIMKGYARLVPKPFKWLSKFSEAKIEKMSFAGQIDINLEVSEGVTFDDYVQQTNEQIDEIFEVDEDTIEEIREPLVDVLMEQELELTPQQRLGMAVLSHLMQMFTVAMKLRNQNNRILAYQKEITRMASANVA